MMPPRKVKQAKKDDERDGTVGTGRGHDEDDSGDPDLDIEEGRLMQAKPIKKQKIEQASQEHGGTRKPISRRPFNALTAAVGHRVEDTTGSKPQEPAKPRKPKTKDPPPPAISEAGDSDTRDDISDEEDAMG